MRLAFLASVICTAALVSLGLVVMVSSEIGITWSTEAGRQLMWSGIGVVAAMVMAMLDYRWLRHAVWPAFCLALVLLVAVLVMGKEAGGAQRWLALGSLGTFQPSEFSKFAVILLLAYYCERNQRFMHTFWRGVAVPGMLVGVVLVLVFLERDWKSTILITGLSGVVLLVAGIRWRYVFLSGAVGAVLFVLGLAQNEVRYNRVVNWYNAEEADESGIYQNRQAELAIANGGVLGRGLGQGQIYGSVPAFRTDFIFALVGEELGLVGSASVVVAFMLFLISGVAIAWRAKDTFGLLLGVGVTMLIAMQAFVNVGVVTGVLPNTGLALPFVSKGGTNLVMTMMMVGVLFSVAVTTAREGVQEPGAAELDDLGAAAQV
ncbi:MAG: FtsW/RodA/SpoVE family cell cycle protein [Limisphaerales bacterium]|jgi:cell division protein FtsW